MRKSINRGLAAVGTLGLVTLNALAATNSTVAGAITDSSDTANAVVAAMVTLIVVFTGLAFLKKIRRAG